MTLVESRSTASHDYSYIDFPSLLAHYHIAPKEFHVCIQTTHCAPRPRRQNMTRTVVEGYFVGYEWPKLANLAHLATW